MNLIITIEFIVYLCVILGVGIYFSRRKMTQVDFHLGGKKIPGWALALSERATGESAWCLLGLTGFAFSAGLSSVWIAIGCVAGIIVSWLWLAREFRRERDKYDILTLPDYFATKYTRQGTFIRWFSSLIIIFFFVLYVAAQFSGGGKTLNITFGLPVTLGIILSAIVVILYAILGGFFSVVWTDVIQALLMIITLVVTPIVALVAISRGGLSITNALATAGGGVNSWVGGTIGFSVGVLIVNNFSWFFGYLGGQPQLDARWMAMKSDKDVKVGAGIAIVWTLLAYTGAIVLGLAAITLYGQGVVADPEQILPYMLIDLMPAWLAGLLLAGAVAAMMSTADSQLLIATSSISEDIIHKSLRKNIGDRTLVLISRVTILVVGAIALVLAFTSKSLIYTLVHFAWAGIGCSFSPAVILSFFWKRFSTRGVIASLVSGFVVTVLWIITGWDTVIAATVVTFCVAFLCAVIVTLASPPPEEK
ncbi:MAG: sodium/proline symporter [candidate division WOR-3 bacterium]|nr:MAG: sodium/proline symporter [candidate division WOR-3 bacterium]